MDLETTYILNRKSQEYITCKFSYTPILFSYIKHLNVDYSI